MGEALVKIAFFKKSDKEGGTNPTVLAGLAEGLLSEDDLILRLEWARLLSGCFMNEFATEPAANRATRRELLHAITPLLAGRVKDALSKLMNRGKPEEQEITKELHAAWGEALLAR